MAKFIGSFYKSDIDILYRSDSRTDDRIDEFGTGTAGVSSVYFIMP